MKKRFRWILAGAGGLFGAALLVNPTLPEMAAAPGGDVAFTNAPPAEIAATLRTACYDCHSSETQWPWYSRVAPMSWWLVEHVNEGRRELNFSDWPHDDARRAAKKWRSIANEVGSGAMPLPSYTWNHPEARLTEAQRDTLVTWARGEADRLTQAQEGQ